MKTVFLDTNIMIDIIGRRQQFCRPSLQIMSLADRGILRVCVSALSYATASFILSRDNKQMDIISEFTKFARITTTSPVDAETIEESIHSDFDDFEDAMLYFSAMRESIDFIVTRNKKDYKAAQIPVFEPQEFIDFLLQQQVIP